ncbi:WW domain-binding protein 4-like [Elysia marginata]|uniref:WW domain-binding protein 4-like n=1 Tax=Elysia marginata TaxID=1093978 RepID=A0AAV4JVS0_9GAST|nr:WW domain-binding protein 4-like [Elysia marginata]
MYVNKDWATNITVRETANTPDYEILHVSFRPHYLPREFTQVPVILVYVPGPNNNAAADRIADCYNSALARSEYWKSVPRKFCDFCKCWITDNKPSVDFHERGKRHQENVELRLREVRKKSLQQSKDDEQMKAQMDRMEKAALEAFKKDLKNNPELAAQYGVSLEPKPKPETDSETSGKDAAKLSEGAGAEESGKKKKKKKKSKTKKEWYEAQSPEGYSYYWSTVTGESKWEAPEDYVSLAEQREEEAEEEKAETSESQSTDKKEKPAETVPEKQLETAKVSISSAKIVMRDAGHARSAYGSWDVVKEVERPQMYDETSLPPALEEIPLPVADIEKTEQAEPEPKKSKLKEKIVTLGPTSGGPVAFKKRKIAGARNVRQKTDDD